MRSRLAISVVAAAALSIVVVPRAPAIASTGDLTAQDCFGATSANPAGCAATAKGLRGASSIALSRDGISVYVASYFANAVQVFNRDPTTGVLTAAGCIASVTQNPDGCASTAKGLQGADGVAVTPDGTSVYVVSNLDNAIVRFTRNTTTGALTLVGCRGDAAANPAGCSATAKGLLAPTSVVSSADSSSIYVTGELDNTVVTFDRDTSTGALTPAGCIASATHNSAGCSTTAKGLFGADMIALSPDNKTVYVTGKRDNAIVRFSRDAGTGALTWQGCTARTGNNPGGCPATTKGLAGATGAVVSADGTSVYVTGVNDNALVEFTRNTSSGGLTSQGCIGDSVNNTAGCGTTAKALLSATPIATSKDKLSVYVGSVGDDAMVVFSRAANGLLTETGCIGDVANNPAACTATTKGLGGAAGIIVSGNGKWVYQASANDNAVVRFARA